MERFFEEWIYRGGEPEYTVRYENMADPNGRSQTRIHIEQVHNTNEVIGLFDMPVNFEVHYKDGTFDRQTQRIKEKQEVVTISNPANKGIDFILFDPGRKIIKKVNFVRSYEELAAQALKAGNMIDRYDALLALKEFPLSQKRADLYKCYQQEKFFLTKGEIIAQLSPDDAGESLEVLSRAINDTNDKVRLAVAQNLKSVPASLKKEYEKLLSDQAFLTIELALDNLCRSFPADRNRYLSLTKDLEGWRGKNIRIKWLEISIENGNRKVLPELKKYSSSSYEFETRINAMNALKRLNVLDEEVALNMLQAATHWNYKIKTAAIECLGYFYTQDVYKVLLDNLVAEKASPAAKTEFEKIRKAKS
jgi:hypothetical protein